MPVDTKKVLWTVISVGLFLVVFFGTALLLFAPRRGAPQAPAAIGNEAPPRASEPDEYLRNPAPAPSLDTAAKDPSGDVVVVYGENPPASALPGSLAPNASTASQTAEPGASPGTAPAAPVGSALPAPSKSGTYTPAPSNPAAKAPAAAKPSAAKPKTVTVSEWWIQASSPTSRSRAESLQAELARKGLASVITLKDIDGTTHYRVRIGPYASEKEAQGWRDRIRALPDCSEAYVSKTTVQRTM